MPNHTLKYFSFFVIAAFISLHLNAQSNKTTTRILFLLDGSSSMNEDWHQTQSRFEAAKLFIKRLSDSITQVNPDVEFGLRVFGHQYGVEDNNCYDSKLEVSFSKMNYHLLSRRLQYIFPQGVSPIAWSLKQSAEYDFQINKNYKYSLILLTDGGESCNGDICATMANLVNKRISFTPYIISLIDYGPLRKDYECMGEYLVVKDAPTMEQTIKYLLDQNNNFESNLNTTYTPKTPVTSTNPTIIQQPETKPIVNQSRQLNMIMLSLPPKFLSYKINLRPDRIPLPKLPKINPPSETSTTPQVTNEVPKVVAPEKKNIAKIALPISFKRLSYKTITIPKPVAIKLLPLIKLPEEEIVLVKKQINKIELDLAPKRINYMFSIATAKPVKLPKLPKIVIYASDLVSTNPFNKPPQTTDNNPVNADAKPTITNENKQNPLDPGTFQLFFTNGQGKYYSTEPSLEVTDLKTNRIIWTGERRMGANKQPRPITIPDGNYSVKVVGSGRKASFKIEKGTNKKVEIVVSRGSLSFAYKGSREKPSGFIAKVSKRFEPGPVIDHPTEEVLPYESANYHIEVNTLPPSLFNVDLVFDINTEVTLLKAGTVQILNENELGRVEFWYQLGDNYLRFYEMNILGDPEFQKIDFRAGPYMVKYRIKNEKGQIVEKSKKFILYADKTEQLFLE